MEGCYHGQLECVGLLVERGASWHTRDHSGEVSISPETELVAERGAFFLQGFRHCIGRWMAATSVS